jgi:hypothetical protein
LQRNNESWVIFFEKMKRGFDLYKSKPLFILVVKVSDDFKASDT